MEREKKALLGIRVSKAFRRRVRLECAGRGLSIQWMVIDALEIYFSRIPPAGRKYEGMVTGPRRAQARLWGRYLDKMPQAKVEMMVSAMEWDLRALKSSRLKPRP